MGFGIGIGAEGGKGDAEMGAGGRVEGRIEKMEGLQGRLTLVLRGWRKSVENEEVGGGGGELFERGAEVGKEIGLGGVAGLHSPKSRTERPHSKYMRQIVHLK